MGPITRARAKGLQNLVVRVRLDNIEPNEVQFMDSSLLGCCNFNELHVTILQDDSKVKANARIKANGTKELGIAYPSSKADNAD